MLELITPDPRRYAEWQSWAQEFRADGTRQDGAGSPPPADSDHETFLTWIKTVQSSSDPNSTPAPGYVHSTHWWLQHNHQLVGAINLRHSLTAALLRNGGHIGYSIRPSARRQGLATLALRLVLDVAQQRGLKRVLLTCNDHNVASARTIERCGGVLEDKQLDSQGTLARRYWIELATHTHCNTFSGPDQLRSSRLPTTSGS